jgi:hypothetical protein
VALLAFLASAALVAADEPKPTRFHVTYTPNVNAGPLSTRVYVMLAPSAAAKAPRFGPDWMDTQPFFAVDAKGWKPGEPLEVGADAVGFPGPLAELKPGTYSAQAVIRLNPDTHKLGDGDGNAYGPIAEIKVPSETGEPIALTVDTLVKPAEFKESANVKLVDIPSPLLSAFYMRPLRQRAAVILPEDALGGKARYPTLYIIPGFGGDHSMAPLFMRNPRFGYAKNLIRVVLDPDCGTGHHVFADSAVNGPRGRALVEELIPYIEKTYPAIAEPGARLLNGHSSGGWSSLWLQVTYPDFFGGTWSTSPDPVDFRDFSGVNLYAEGENLFHDRAGNRRPIVRMGGNPVLYIDHFSKMEDVIGDGGQFHSFEAVFSPRGPGGSPRPLSDRRSGAIDPETVKGWRKYDVRLKLEQNWKTLGPKLAGKLHIITGDVDTFYLDGAVKLLKESLKTLGSDAVVDVLPNKDHMNIMDAELVARLDHEMNAAVARYLPRTEKAGAGPKP